MFNTEFNHVAENPSFDLYPPNLRSIIDETNEWIHDGINNGVYNCGFATNQEAYDVVKQLCDLLSVYANKIWIPSPTNLFSVCRQ